MTPTKAYTTEKCRVSLIDLWDCTCHFHRLVKMPALAGTPPSAWGNVSKDGHNTLTSGVKISRWGPWSRLKQELLWGWAPQEDLWVQVPPLTWKNLVADQLRESPAPVPEREQQHCVQWSQGSRDSHHKHLACSLAGSKVSRNASYLVKLHFPNALS